ncbi:patatin-like phospholipase family protein [Anaerorhabdus sp.]|jgi:predicted patatin/cPLA2 family phospholipase|uniref:patatin-like phospholipase family protein n=1 Tax=Anaerorhabdus sp. TaxID=1872524 RepID=UPI002FCBE527
MNKVGLILEGGGMRGVFTTGVLDCFLDNNIEFNEIIGVSAGACHACSYVSKQRGRAKSINVDYIDDKRYCSVYSLITTGDMFGVDFVYGEIPNVLNPFDHDTYNHSNTKVYAAVTNIETGKPEYHLLDDMTVKIDNLRASASLPFVSRVVNIDGQKYLDGGLIDSIPIKKIETDGFKKNVIVLTQPKGYRKSENKLAPLAKLIYRKYPKMFNIMKQRHILYNDTVDYIEQQEALGNLFVIQPKEKLNIGRIEKDKSKLEAIYKLGYECTQDVLDQLKSYMEK